MRVSVRVGRSGGAPKRAPTSGWLPNLEPTSRGASAEGSRGCLRRSGRWVIDVVGTRIGRSAVRREWLDESRRVQSQRRWRPQAVATRRLQAGRTCSRGRRSGRSSSRGVGSASPGARRAVVRRQTMDIRGLLSPAARMDLGRRRKRSPDRFLRRGSRPLCRAAAGPRARRGGHDGRNAAHVQSEWCAAGPRQRRPSRRPYDGRATPGRIADQTRPHRGGAGIRFGALRHAVGRARSHGRIADHAVWGCQSPRRRSSRHRSARGRIDRGIRASADRHHRTVGTVDHLGAGSTPRPPNAGPLLTQDVSAAPDGRGYAYVLTTVRQGGTDTVELLLPRARVSRTVATIPVSLQACGSGSHRDVERIVDPLPESRRSPTRRRHTAAMGLTTLQPRVN